MVVQVNQNIVTTAQRSRQVKDYICHHFSEEPHFIAKARERSREMGLKPIHVPQHVGKMLYLLTRLQRPKKILEIGTLGGYSTLWLALGMEDEGRVFTLECQEKHIEVARENFKYAGFEEQITIYQGMAADLLQELMAQKVGPFDLIFIDADKENYPEYLEPCLRLSRSGTLILSDNLIPKRGEIGNPDPRDIEAIGIYTYNQMIANHPQLEASLFSTIVGEKYRMDALGVAIVK